MLVGLTAFGKKARRHGAEPIRISSLLAYRLSFHYFELLPASLATYSRHPRAQRRL
jgi:hypothetical protein